MSTLGEKTKYREQRDKDRRLEMKDMVKYLQNAIKNYEKIIESLKEDVEIFREKGLNVGDFAFHKEYGKCMINDIRLIMSKVEKGFKVEIYSPIHGVNNVAYADLVKPGPGVEVLFEERKAE